MTVAELIIELQKFDPNLSVGYQDQDLRWNPHEIHEVYKDDYTRGIFTKDPETTAMVVVATGSEGL